MKAFPLLLPILVVLYVSWSCRAADSPGRPTRVPSSIELQDQYKAPHKLSFPSTNITVLTIADRKGSEQVDGWIAVLKPRYAGRINLVGIADVAGAPRFVRGRIRKKFQESRQYPVMMDWSGNVCAQLGRSENVANILVVGSDGVILGRFTGVAEDTNITAACAVLDKAVSSQPGEAAGR